MSVNKAILLGNVGKDPEVRDVSGSKVANFTLATTEKGYTKQDGTQVPERTEWHNIVVWGKLATVVQNYVRKGTKMYIEGKIRTRSYDDKSGNKRYVTEVFADTFDLCGGNPQNQQAAPVAAPGYQQPNAYQPAPGYQQGGYQAASPQPNVGYQAPAAAPMPAYGQPQPAYQQPAYQPQGNPNVAPPAGYGQVPPPPQNQPQAQPQPVYPTNTPDGLPF